MEQVSRVWEYQVRTKTRWGRHVGIINASCLESAIQGLTDYFEGDIDTIENLAEVLTDDGIVLYDDEVF